MFMENNYSELSNEELIEIYNSTANFLDYINKEYEKVSEEND